MNILAIGNSFSQDATRYLHQIARTDGVELNCFNLCIGGCSLYRHFKNMKGNIRQYTLGMNGWSTGVLLTLEEGLLNREWDVITIQQVSEQSVDFETYEPYLSELAKYIRELAPKSKLYIHQTWGYETGSARIRNVIQCENYEEMFARTEQAYEKAAEVISADGMILSGRMIKELLGNGIEKIHRDGFHLKLGVGRYAAGLLWYKTLTGNSVTNNAFCDFDEEVPESEIQIVKKIIDEKF